MVKPRRGQPYDAKPDFLLVRLVSYKTLVIVRLSLLGPAALPEPAVAEVNVYSAPPHGATGRVPETQTAEGQWRSTSKETPRPQ